MCVCMYVIYTLKKNVGEFTIAKIVRYITYGEWICDNSELIGQTLQLVDD